MKFARAIRQAARLAAALLFLGLSWPAFAAAPAPIQTFEGRLQVQVEDHPGQRSLTHYFLQMDGRRFELRNARGTRGLPSGTRVRVRGLATGNVLALDSSGSSNLVATSPATLDYASGAQSVAVIMVNFVDDAVQPISAASMQSAVFGTTSDFLRENSGGLTWLGGSVFGWYTLALSKSGCDPVQIASLADQAATAAGANLAAYTRKFYVFPKNACTWAGLADVGGASTRAWFNGKFDLDNFGHEFGHNLGLMHSHGLDCDVSAFGDVCTPLSYGDAADIMGNLEGHYNAFQKERLGWSTGLTEVSASGRYTLAPYESSGGMRALKISRGVDAAGLPAWYYLEYRQPTGFDAVLGYYGTLAKGVLLRAASGGDGDSSYLLDMTPNSDTSSGFVDLWDSALMAGRSYGEPAKGISISVVSADASSAVLDITVAAGACVRAAPAVAIAAVPSATAGAQVAVAVTVTNRDSSACAATSFNLGSVVPAGWSSKYSASSLSISAGASASSVFSLTSSGSASAGNYAFSVNAGCSRGSACAGATSGSQTVLASSLSETVASSKAVYSRGELVGMGAQVLNNGVPVSGAAVTFTITRPNGSTVTLNASTGSNGTASASYRLSKQKDPVGSYGLRAQASVGGSALSAATSFKVQ